MKTLNILLVITSIFFLASCQKEDLVTVQEKTVYKQTYWKAGYEFSDGRVPAQWILTPLVSEAERRENYALFLTREDGSFQQIESHCFDTVARVGYARVYEVKWEILPNDPMGTEGQTVIVADYGQYLANDKVGQLTDYVVQKIYLSKDTGETSLEDKASPYAMDEIDVLTTEGTDTLYASSGSEVVGASLAGEEVRYDAEKMALSEDKSLPLEFYQVNIGNKKGFHFSTTVFTDKITRVEFFRNGKLHSILANPQKPCPQRWISQTSFKAGDIITARISLSSNDYVVNKYLVLQ